jgi:hypothetical protein
MSFVRLTLDQSRNRHASYAKTAEGIENLSSIPCRSFFEPQQNPAGDQLRSLQTSIVKELTTRRHAPVRLTAGV